MDQNNTFRKYSTYKDSGVVWLGEVPSHWDQRRVKFQLTYQKGKNPKDFVFEETDWVYLSMEYLRSNQAKIQYIKNTKGCILVNNDEILMLWDGSNAGEFIKSKKGILSSTMALITLSNSDQNYAWHYLKVIEIQLRESTIGMGIPHVSSDEFKNLLFLLPPPEEQTRIAHFLDRKTNQIDQAIAQKERLIALLKERRQILIHKAVTRGLDPNVKMKDSGVEWIGEVPEHWEVMRLKQCSSKISKGTTPSTEGRSILDEGAIRYIKAENIQDGFITDYPAHFIDEKTNSLIKRSELRENDVLFVIAGATLGKVAIISSAETPSNTNQAVAFVRPNSIVLPRFLSIWLTSSVIRELTWLDAVQSAQPNLSLENLGNFPIFLPSFKEQKSIIEYVQKIETKIATAINLKQAEIEKLKEYKATLINSAVTGKIKA